MKATLTIEVPDDFKKGECKKCSFYGFRRSNTGASPRWCILGCDYDNCPLEIQEESKAKPYKCKTKCKDCVFWDICIHSDLQENNQ